MNLDLLRCTHVECRRAGPIPAKYLLETSYRVCFLYAGTIKQEAAFLHLTTWSPPERKSENQPTILLPYCSSLVTKAPPSVLRVRGQVMKLLNRTDQRNIEQIQLDIHSPGTKFWRSNIPPSISYTPPSPCILVPIVTHFLSSSGLLAFLVQ